MHSGKDVTQKGNQEHLHLRQSRISLVALSQHKGVPVSSELTSNLERLQPSFNTLSSLHCLGHFHHHHESHMRHEAAFRTPESNETHAGGRELYAPTNSILQVKLSSIISIDRDKSWDNFSSVVTPSVFDIIPELQRGQSSYHIDYGESLTGATSGWYTNLGDIDYLWSVIPSAETLSESVKAAVLDTYTDNSLPTILQPRFKAKAPGTSLALWVPNIMASLAKRLNEETAGELAPGGDKSKDIVKQNIGLLLKRDFISPNWPFKGTLKSRQSDGATLSEQQRHRRKIDHHHRTKVKHLRGEDKLEHSKHNTHKECGEKTTTMEKSTWRGWRRSSNKNKLKYVEPQEEDTKLNDGVELEKYVATPKSRRRGVDKSQDCGSVDSGRSSAEFPDIDIPVFAEDSHEESMVFFNYSDDGSSYTCTVSPLQSLSKANSAQDLANCTNDAMSSVTSVYSDDDTDSEFEEELYEESFRLETEHVNCECIKYRESPDEFPYLKTLEDIENKEPNVQAKAAKAREPLDNTDKTTSGKSKSGSLKRRGSLRRMSSRQRRITDSGRMPKSSSKDTADDGISEDSDPKLVQYMKDVKDKIEYMRVASQEDANISAKLFIRIPEKIHLCKLQTHLLLCAMRAFFTCNEGIQVRWVKSLHTKIYQLLQRSDTKIKFSGGENEDFVQNSDTVCLLLSHDAAVLLRDRHSSLLTSVADILQLNQENLLVLELQETEPSVKKTKKSKGKKTPSVELNESGVYDVQSEWFLPVFV